MVEQLKTADDRKTAADSEQQVRLIRLREVVAKTGLSRSAIYAAVKVGRFPAPLSIMPGGRASAWVEAEVDTFLRQRIEQSRKAAS